MISRYNGVLGVCTLSDVLVAMRCLSLDLVAMACVGSIDI